jgi:hypothetical protein
MKKEKGEEIIGYRIGQGLFCVKCYEEGARTLKAVQNAEDPEVKFPAKSIKKGDIRIFICEQCETIKGDPKVLSIEKQVELEALREQKIREMRLNVPSQFEKEKSLTDLEDMIVDSCCKLSFVGSFFCQKPLGGEPEISEEDASGIHIILREIEDDLSFIQNKISQKKRKGLIIEKQEAN